MHCSHNLNRLSLFLLVESRAWREDSDRVMSSVPVFCSLGFPALARILGETGRLQLARGHGTLHKNWNYIIAYFRAKGFPLDSSISVWCCGPRGPVNTAKFAQFLYVGMVTEEHISYCGLEFQYNKTCCRGSWNTLKSGLTSVLKASETRNETKIGQSNREM